jgi:REP element-mobilizing transposase RayT
MDLYLLLSSTFYGNWLPGDPRGFVSRVRDQRPDDPEASSRHKHNIPGTPCDEDLGGLYRAAQRQMRGPPIRINLDQATALLGQFQETAAYRGWELLAVAIMANHVHLVVGVNAGPTPTKVLGDFKAYGSRALNARWGKPVSETWWTYDGSKRKLADEQAVIQAVGYLRDQEFPLVVWISPRWAQIVER